MAGVALVALEEGRFRAVTPPVKAVTPPVKAEAAI
jgi:hypothetical protein